MQNLDINNIPKNTMERLASECYLAAACLQAGVSSRTYDDLNVLKNFQEEYLPKDRIGLLYLKTYHKAAPQIVENINTHPSKKAIYTFIYQIIQQCVDAIKKGALDAALRVLVNMMHNIQLRYGLTENIV